VPNDLGTLIATDVARGEADFQNVRGRALSVVSVAGGLVTLVTGFLAVAAGSNKNFLPSSARWSVLAALLAYILSTISALIVNLPGRVTVASAENLRRLAEENWNDEDWDRQVAILLAEYLVSLRRSNAWSIRWVTAAIAFEITGIAATSAMALLVIQHLP
jgi:hypothetical protein